MHIVIMLFLISILIVVHEFGHFLAAKIFGVRVEKFAIGLPFGPTLFKKKIGETEFLIHAFIFGGYVSFPDDEKKDKGKDELPDDSPLRYKNKKPWQKAIILFAGVGFNIIFAIFLTIVTALLYKQLPGGETEVYIAELSEARGSNVIERGLLKGDRILKVNGVEVKNGSEINNVVKRSGYFDGFVSDEIVNTKYEALLKLNGNKEIIPAHTLVKLPEMTPEAQLKISENAARGWEKYRTKEKALNDKEINFRDKSIGKKEVTTDEDITLKEIANAISDSYKPVTLTVLRKGETVDVTGLRVGVNGYLGISLIQKNIYLKTNGFYSAVSNSCNYLWMNTKNMIFGLWQLVTGKLQTSELHSFVAITKIGGDIIKEQGLLNGLLLTAIISINLAIMNLLPIPALDGGHLMILFIEKITGHKMDEKIIDKINDISFMLLIGLMLLAFYNDVSGIITHKF